LKRSALFGDGRADAFEDALDGIAVVEHRAGLRRVPGTRAVFRALVSAAVDRVSLGGSAC